VKREPRKLVIFTDGGARGNPGPAGIGVTISDEHGTVLTEFGEAIGETTNNVAEYTAVLRALEAVADYDINNVEFFLDSELVVKQLNGEYKVKNAGLKGLHAAARERLDKYGEVRIRHIPRAENEVADRLANEAMDRVADGDEEPLNDSVLPGQGSLF